MIYNFTKPVIELVYVTLKPVKALFGLDQETVTDDSVTLLNTISVAGSGPGEAQRHVSVCVRFVCVTRDADIYLW